MEWLIPSDVSDSLDGFIDISEFRDRSLLKKTVFKGLCEIKPSPGHVARIHYKSIYYGGVQHNQQFYSTRDCHGPIEIIFQEENVIKALLICVRTMNIGEVCELISSPEYAYNDGQWMKFVIQLFGIKSEYETIVKSYKTVKLTTVTCGRGKGYPVPGFEATICYRLLCTRAPEQLREVTYIVSDTRRVPECIDLAVQHMRKDEHVLVRVCYPRDDADNEIELEKAVYELRLKSFERVASISSLFNFELEMSTAELLKAKANAYLKDGRTSVAIAMYNSLISDLTFVCTDDLKDEKTLAEMVAAVRLNLALAYIKQKDGVQCAAECQKVLDADACNEKALFRLGQSCLLRSNHAEAMDYFKRVLTINPSNAAALNELHRSEKLLNACEQKEERLFKSAFERLKQVGFGDID